MMTWARITSEKLTDENKIVQKHKNTQLKGQLNTNVSNFPTLFRYDDNTLQAMTMCYKETNRPAGIVSIYEVAVQVSCSPPLPLTGG